MGIARRIGRAAGLTVSVALPTLYLVGCCVAVAYGVADRIVPLGDAPAALITTIFLGPVMLLFVSDVPNVLSEPKVQLIIATTLIVTLALLKPVLSRALRKTDASALAKL
jgi:hypothetical protein